MASLTSVGELGQTSYNKNYPPDTPSLQELEQGEQEDYFEIDECYVADQDHTPSDHHHTNSHTHNHHSESESESDETGDARRPSGDSLSHHIMSSVTAHTKRESAQDNDYENQEILERQMQDDSSDEEEDCELRVIKSVVREELDYMNSSELDRELEIKTGTGVNCLATNYQKTEKLESERHGNSGNWNGTGVISLEEPDYANSEAIDAELFKDNIKKSRDCPTSAYDINSSLSEHPLTETENSPRDVISCNPLPVGMVQKRYAPVRCHSTLHRESEIKIELAEKTENLDPTVLNATSEADINSPDGLGDTESNILLTERVKSSITPYSIRPSYLGKSTKTNPDLSRLGTFERTLLQTNGPTTLAMPNILQIPWYHEGITRHIAESLLMSKTIRDGTYLLRDSVHSNESVTLSVRCQQSVKHYRILWDGKQFSFGLGKFPDLESLKDHFENQPVISGESGILVQLAYPYPRAVAEPAIYTDPAPVNEAAKDTVVSNDVSNEKPVPKKWIKKDKVKSTHAHSVSELSVNSKEGYLTKQGYRVKNWKRRWFILFRNELKYYINQESKEPIRVIDLNDATAVERDETQGKPYCFRLVTPNRTFFMYGTSETESNEWIQILDWKLSRRSRSNSRV